MNVPFVDLKKHHAPMVKAFRQAVDQVVKNNQFILSEPVKKFEEEFARLVGARYAIGLASGTDALHLSLRAAGIGPGDQVLIPSMTFAATALAVLYAGAVPVCVDVREEDALMDLNDATRALTPRTKAIIPVHLYGQVCDMEALATFARVNRLTLIEDACQAHGAKWKGRAAGTFGVAGCFSFYPSKNLGALGDGGLAVTNDESIWKKLQMLRNYGQPVKYKHETLGFNSRLDGLQAAFLRIKLKRLNAGNAARKKHAAQYKKILSGLPLKILSTPESIYHLFVIRTAQRQALQEALHQEGIETGIHYPIPIHRQGFMQDIPGTRPCPVSERLAGDMLSLPMFPDLSPAQIKHVGQTVRRFFEKSSRS